MSAGDQHRVPRPEVYSACALPINAIGFMDNANRGYLATKHQMTVMGENPGNTPASDIDGIVALVQSCHLVALQWAWDYTLHDDNGSAPLAAVAAAMSSTHALRPVEPSP